MKVALLHITKRSELICKKIATLLKESTSIIKVESGDIHTAMKKAWSENDAIVAVMASGIVVRATAPLLKDKTTDPAVIVVDEAGKFAIPLISGHIGGANALANAVAKVLGATAVITTASDVNGLPAIDLHAKAMSYTISDKRLYGSVVGKMVDGENVGVFIEPDIHDDFFLSAPFVKIDSSKLIAHEGPRIAVTWNIIAPDILHLIPKRVAIGVGLHKNTDTVAFSKFVSEALLSAMIWPQSVKFVATIKSKGDEPAVKELARAFSAELLLFDAKELDEAGAVSSERVRHYTGSGSVSEAAARLAGGGRIILEKTTGRGMTICAALCS